MGDQAAKDAARDAEQEEAAKELAKEPEKANVAKDIKKYYVNSEGGPLTDVEIAAGLTLDQKVNDEIIYGSVSSLPNIPRLKKKIMEEGFNPTGKFRELKFDMSSTLHVEHFHALVRYYLENKCTQKSQIGQKEPKA